MWRGRARYHTRLAHDRVHHNRSDAGAAHALRQSAIGRVHDQRTYEIGIEHCDPYGRRLVTEGVQHSVGRTLQRDAADDWRYRDAGVTSGNERLANPCHPEHRTDRNERVGRGDHDSIGTGYRVQHSGGGGRVVDPDELDAVDVGLVMVADEILLEPE